MQKKHDKHAATVAKIAWYQSLREGAGRVSGADNYNVCQCWVQYPRLSKSANHTAESALLSHLSDCIARLSSFIFI